MAQLIGSDKIVRFVAASRKPTFGNIIALTANIWDYVNLIGIFAVLMVHLPHISPHLFPASRARYRNRLPAISTRSKYRSHPCCPGRHTERPGPIGGRCPTSTLEPLSPCYRSVGLSVRAAPSYLSFGSNQLVARANQQTPTNHFASSCRSATSRRR